MARRSTTKTTASRAKPARKAKPRKTAGRKASSSVPLRQRLRRAWKWTLIGLPVTLFVGIAAPSVLNPPTTFTMWSEGRRLGMVEHVWVPMEAIAPVMQRSAVAAEDANFCLHWGFDMRAIRGALAANGRYGASTITQQTVKNVFLWQGRSWPRKALEAVITPVVELTWSKRRILEVYLNVAEFGEGIFGIDAAAREHFGVPPARLSPSQAAALAVILPNPKERNPANLSPTLRRRANQVRDGAATIRLDNRDDCFEG
ncbi:monofunctional biosynthetic peptidoglycan transglycosylase [Rhodovulum sp. P5]|uniref:monofunctional biosynthetic peptidoglycan transglycosylase n=1 Tax=Rhodovulum sp. P5 TaxID=1564506 RepID=UPI0009DB30CE|nr:monofunctional biosynthetic peptidoglycan transglycosylase [Rhodovulum sp. P5]